MSPESDLLGMAEGRIRSLCRSLPESYEEPAWVGTRWMIRNKNFAHVLPIEDGWPPAYARVAGTSGPACVLTFRCPLDEIDAYREAGQPFFVPPWFPNIVGLLIDDDTDWEEVAECITESYRVLAPKRLAARISKG